MKRLGLFFGSFNPIHLGHLAIAEFMLEKLKFDKILFIVSPQNPFKSSADLYSEEKRLKWVQNATQYNPRFEASDIEFSLPKPSYTYNTLQKLNTLYPDTHFSIIMGSDNLARLKDWKNIDLILETTDFEIFQRSGTDKTETFHPNIHLHHTPFIDISATEIRQRLNKGMSVKDLVPSSILEQLK
ncbi:MAG: nicotinate-nucleotide adenylyltransferase [Bacteroidia bacterium]|nr:nicotinate-nucleotide adenylyltransferase [Bacteroidia bacterium]MCO5253158.1 nicotinate (nicotinamide) nucleotide adenylyltransferase [Bacteroidota bacterium]MCZ2128769.1 nicotinate-nucleotide adenylyltransferase [Bacteroidia bacterium]